jgi:hypothetical protein
MKSQKLVGALALIVGAATPLDAGCVVHAQGSASAEAEAPVVFVAPPTLVEVDGGVWVASDADYATYYVDDYYWVYRGGTWYRSRSYDGGWVVVEVAIVPTIIVHRDPNLYVHYRVAANAHTRRAPRDENPGMGNERRAQGDQGEDERHHEGPAKNEQPGVGNERKREGTQPGQVGKGRSGHGGSDEDKDKDKDKDRDKGHHEGH